ncbi:methylated DNA--protein cysteine S-methyltransferase [Geotalea daltonii FRC-32]|uniref:methylated-DNA--[protein]-cysteine S-methyltransferase n=1 Tax=Geotalea daltonii (strain DSM 22248 / JCM 15807 / FRC-32) TaxID=316067 RepID=B9M7E7_GEODF|nr:methylated-DNA--[protein]-cysteine S-methyltransferase [Geotalea daltonii]ACM20235.1 methylated DNA--protein cysteine S-methyltransferase [Geotalea daltonii FRC-32]
MRKPARPSAQYFSLYSSPMGSGGVVAGAAGLIEVFLPFAGGNRAEMHAHIGKLHPGTRCSNELTERCAALLQRYFAGERVEFPLELDKTGFTPFQTRVYELVAAIPYGCVKTYAQVAAEMGCKGAARGVGTAMARNPLPIIIPCHRIVGASGTMTGYSAAGGISSKRILLMMEGISLDAKGRVVS